MNKNTFWIALAFVCILLLPVSAFSKEDSEKVVGKMTLNLNMISTENRVLDYGKEYYGSYYLIITFFPAAYTPV